MTHRQLITFACAVLLLFVGACSATPEPEIPNGSGPAAVAEKLSGPNAAEWLRDLTDYEWSDDGQRAAEALAWVASDAQSTDAVKAARAGAAAHNLATFLADNPDDVRAAGSKNPDLLEAYAKALIPYIGAMVGHPSGTTGFAPLDTLGGQMPKTTQLFASLAGQSDGGLFTRAASDRAAEYETEFVDYAASNPAMPGFDFEESDLALAARLRGLITAGARAAGVQPDPSTERSPYELQYMIVSRMVHGSDPRIGTEFFNPDGSLKSPEELDGGSWSRYNGQLAGYLAGFPQLADAVERFRDTSTAVG